MNKENSDKIISLAYTENLFHNAKLFSSRFPELAESLGINSDEGVKKLAEKIPNNYLLVESKLCGRDIKVFTASINGKYIHSKYNPINEAEKHILSDFFLDTKIKSSCIFYGLGLGYIQELYAKKNKTANLIIVEPDIFIFLLFLASRPLDYFFLHENLILLLGLYPNDVLNFFEANSFFEIPIFKNTALIDVNASWFYEFETLKKRRDEKDNLNKNTLKRFGELWLKNFFKNMDELQNLSGISQIENMFNSFSCLIITAGPSLDEVLNIIKETQDKFIIIAADTAVRACIRKGINIDFILLMDAQYWNYLHLADLDISSSILITESSVYPAVFRLKTKATFLCTSMFPLAQYVERAIGEKGKLVTGGSVATACWDFARILGTDEIIFCGLDLAFPNFQTHFKGSRFEEDLNATSIRLFPSETASHLSLYAAAPQLKQGYTGTVLSDKRMQMYAWWFESKIAEFPKPKTYNLLPKGLKIPNMAALNKEDFFKKVQASHCSAKIKKEKTESLKKISITKNTSHLEHALNSLCADLEKIKNISKEAIDICQSILTVLKTGNVLDLSLLEKKRQKLDFIDKEIINNKTNKIIGFDLLFNEDLNKRDNSLLNDDLLVRAYEDNLLVYQKIYGACSSAVLYIL